MNIFAPPIVTISRGNVLSIPIHQFVNYDHFDFVKEFEGVQYPPLLVLLEGDESKSTPSCFSNLVDEFSNTSENEEIDHTQLQVSSDRLFRVLLKVAYIWHYNE